MTCRLSLVFLENMCGQIMAMRPTMTNLSTNISLAVRLKSVFGPHTGRISRRLATEDIVIANHTGVSVILGAQDVRLRLAIA